MKVVRDCDDVDVEVLKEYIERYKKYGTISVSSKIKSLRTTMYKMFLECELQLRGIFLMEMYQSESSDFFDIPTVPELFKTIYTQPSLVLFKLSPCAVQGLQQNIVAIYKKPIEFAVAIDHWSREDISDFPIFAYSTFPGIFGYFMGNEFLEAGSSVCYHYFRIAKNLVTSRMLLASIFISATPFYTTLWAQLSAQFRGLKRKPNNGFLFKILMDVLSVSMCHLSPHHLSAFREFCNVFSVEEAVLWLVNTLICPKFETVSMSSGEFVDVDLNAQFLRMLKKLASRPKSKEARRLVSLFCNHNTFVSKYLDMSSGVWNASVQLLISDRDLCILYNIFLTSCNIFSMDSNAVAGLDAQSLMVSILNVTTKFCHEDPIMEGLGQDLFSEQPPSVEVTCNENVLRVWRNLRQLAETRGESDWVNFILTSSAAQQVNMERDFCFLILDKLKKDFCDWETVIGFAEAIRSLKDLKCSVSLSTHRLFHKFSWSFINKVMSQTQERLMRRLISAVNMVCVVEDNVPSDVFYEITCCALDTVTINFEDEAHGQDLCDTFLKVLGKWAETVWVNEQSKFANKLKFVMDSINGLMMLPKMATGKGLKILIQFTLRLSKIMGDKYDEDWLTVFTFSMFCASVPEVLRLFLFYQYDIMSDADVMNGWPPKVPATWVRFANGICTILRQDTDLYTECSRGCPLKLSVRPE